MYAQRDMTDAEIEHDRMICSDDYQAGVEQGWDLAESFHRIPSTRTERGVPNA